MKPSRPWMPAICMALIAVLNCAINGWPIWSYLLLPAFYGCFTYWFICVNERRHR